MAARDLGTFARFSTAGLIALMLAGTSTLAYAADLTPTAGGQTGTGATTVTVQSVTPGEMGGTEDTEHNPDGDGDGWGDNIAFSVPSSINFIANATGTLTGPSAESVTIQNHSAFSIHVSSFRVDTADGWTIVAQDDTSNTLNSIDFQFGPAGHLLDANAYKATRTSITPQEKPNWNMKDSSQTSLNKVALSTSGHLHNVTNDLNSASTVATIHTYVTPGEAA